MRGELVERHRVVGECERREVQSGVVQDAARLAPLRQPRPRHLEDRAHAHPHAAPVERVGAARAHQHRVGAEPGRGAEDRADVRVVDDVLEHDDEPGIGDDVRDRGERRPVHRRERAAMHGVSRELLGDLGLDDVDRRVGVLASASASTSGSHFSCTRNDRGRWPAASARAMTFADSAMYSPPAGSRTRRSATSVRSR